MCFIWIILCYSHNNLKHCEIWFCDRLVFPVFSHNLILFECSCMVGVWSIGLIALGAGVDTLKNCVVSVNWNGSAISASAATS